MQCIFNSTGFRVSYDSTFYRHIRNETPNTASLLLSLFHSLNDSFFLRNHSLNVSLFLTYIAFSSTCADLIFIECHNCTGFNPFRSYVTSSLFQGKYVDAPYLGANSVIFSFRFAYRSFIRHCTVAHWIIQAPESRLFVFLVFFFF